jgi:hypothetical protein
VVEEENRGWQEKFDHGMVYIRDFDVGVPYFGRCTTTDMLALFESNPFSDAQ